MFNTASGVIIPFPEQIEEKYSISENQIMFNISFEKLKAFIDDFVSNLSEPLFLIIQKPLKEKYKPNSFAKGPFKAELYYFDLGTKAQTTEVLDQYGEILLNDGMSEFGVSSHKTGDEIFIAKYKIALIFSKNIKQYFSLLDKYGITETNDLITAWDIISSEYPGERSRVVIDNKDIFYVVEALKDISPMYDSKIIDDTK
ncbi:MAG: hypothetical protein AAGU74_04125 [Bacillota bacterium]